MSKLKTIGVATIGVTVAMVANAMKMKKRAKKTTYVAESMKPIEVRKMGFYEKYIKRAFDVICGTAAVVCFSPLYAGVALAVKLKLGSPVIFSQDRPGLVGKDGKETIFKMYKFRTMTDEKDECGELLPDDKRLTKFGAWLRSTSLDELPEAFNILNGTMSVIGPRPQLIRDLTFMSEEQRKRHTAKPGLSGLAQINGRNSIAWEDKLALDNEYIKKVNIIEDIRIMIETVKKALIKREGIVQDDMATAEDFGDYLLRIKKITREDFINKNNIAKQIINKSKETDRIDMSEHIPFSVVMSVYKNDNSRYFDLALESITEKQTVIPDEIVLVVDGPVGDDINDVIEKYQNRSGLFNIIRLEQNGGLGNALRIAVENAQYELIARMDSDDISLPTRFEEQLRFFRINPETDIVGGNITEFIDDESNIVGIRKVPKNNHEIREYMKKRCAMNHVTVMYKKAAIQSVGGYLDWFWNEDYYLWIRMWLNEAIFANTGTVLVNVRVGKEMYQRRGGKPYFESEKALQDYMLKNKMIGASTYTANVVKRFIIQRVLSNRVRGWVFRTFARSK